jgi:acetate kinase
MKLAVINSGSSTIKYQLYDMPAEHVLGEGVVERIGEPEARVVARRRVGDGFAETVEPQTIADHRAGFAAAMDAIAAIGGPVHGVGHRVVHGGERFRAPALVDQAVMDGIRALFELAPVHNPVNLLGIEVAAQRYPDVPQVAVFDTAFHHSLPPVAYRYALPDALYHNLGVRRYGFHGISYQYLTTRTAELLQQPVESLNLIALHLGNGVSAAAIAGGQSIDTSMGMTPLEGLMMGSRSGDLDPSVPLFLAAHADLDNDQVERLLNHDSGLKGICGVGDMRAVHRLVEAGDLHAKLALDMFCYRIRKTIGAYSAVLGRVDAIVFSGGIGEHDALVREQVCAGLDTLGITVDPERNRSAAGVASEIQTADATMRILVVPTDEELEIARQSMGCIGA